MQPARIKLHAKEHTKRKPQKTISPHGPESPAREDRLERTEGGGFARMCEGHQTHGRRQTEERSRHCSSLEAVVVWTSLGGSLFSDWTQPITGEPIPRSSSTSLGGSLFSDRTHPFTGEPIPRSSTSFTSTRAAQTRACMPLSPPCRARASLSRCLDCYLLSFGPVGVFWPLCVLACFACVHISTFAALFLRMLCMNDTCTIYNRFCLICLTHLVSSKPCCSASSTEASSSSGWTSIEVIQTVWLLVYIPHFDSGVKILDHGRLSKRNF